MGSTTKTAAGMVMLSAYELAREARIRENRAAMAEIGLIQAKEELKEAVMTEAPTKKRRRQSAGVNVCKKEEGSKENNSNAKRSRSGVKSIPSRRSRRLRGERAEIKAGVAFGLPVDQLEERETRNVAHVVDEKMKQRLYRKLLQRHTLRGIELPPRATYEHTVKRVVSMSDKALRTRVKVIERAAGMYAVVKMRMFAEVLLIEGKEEISIEAQGALERLLKLPRFQDLERHYRHVYRLTK